MRRPGTLEQARTRRSASEAVRCQRKPEINKARSGNGARGNEAMKRCKRDQKVDAAGRSEMKLTVRVKVKRNRIKSDHKKEVVSKYKLVCFVCVCGCYLIAKAVT